MNIFKQSPSISQDTLSFRVYPPENTDNVGAAAYATSIKEYVDSHTSAFLWHRDSFDLNVELDKQTERSILKGEMRVGDCLDDEWYIVFLLREISSKWDLAISVNDSDGEFLLIEAAEILPPWVKPTNSENRVWIYNSQLHLIPIEHISSPSNRRRDNRRRSELSEDDTSMVDDVDDEEYISAEEALKVLRDSSLVTRAPAIEDLVWRRISGYPDLAKSHVHKTLAWLPLDVARALSVEPTLVQKAVEAFYTRDAIQLQASHRMSRFHPEPNVLSAVKMTRIAYAQLLGQKFFPPKVFGKWHEREGTKEWKWRDLGMKIACGFEMMYQESKNQLPRKSGSQTGLTDTEIDEGSLRRTSDYQRYLQHLVSSNYFKNEVEGSQLWNELEDKAARMYVEVRQSDTARSNFADSVKKALLNAPQELSSATGDDEDDESWLSIDADSFDDVLNSTIGKNSAQPMDVDEDKEQQEAEIQASHLRDLATKVEDFVNKKGDLEGAIFEDDYLSDDDSDSDAEAQYRTEDHPADRQAAMDSLVAGLNPSEYGKMPDKFYENSQRVKTSAVSEDEEKAKTEKTENPKNRPPIISRDKYDGVESDEDSDEGSEEDSDDDRPQVVEDVEIDMNEEEEEFLEFTRQTLGISDQQWNDIIKDRQDRGAFLPPSAKTIKIEDKPPNRSAQSSAGGNANLNSFESVMRAMDAQLTEHRESKSTGTFSPTPTKSASADEKGKGKANDEETLEDVGKEMEAELEQILLRDPDDEDELMGDGSIDYGMIKNFLESFKSQAGLSGPVSNLAGRLQPGWQLPRDTGLD